MHHVCFPSHAFPWALVHLDKVHLLYNCCVYRRLSSSALQRLPRASRKNPVLVDVLFPAKNEGKVSFPKELRLPFLCSERCRRKNFHGKRNLQNSYMFPPFRTEPKWSFVLSYGTEGARVAIADSSSKSMLVHTAASS